MPLVYYHKIGNVEKWVDFEDYKKLAEENAKLREALDKEVVEGWLEAVVEANKAAMKVVVDKFKETYGGQMK